MSSESVNEMRMKIKRLKYKIEKQQKYYTELKQQNDQLKSFTRIQPSLESVFKKINFLLSLKGMHVGDWLNAVQYDTRGNKNQMRLSELVQVLDKIGIRLSADQKFVLLNFVSQTMSEVVTRDQLVKCAQKSGVRAYD